MTDSTITTTEQPGQQRRRAGGIRNLMPGLVERGKIKIGAKGAERPLGGGREGTWQAPVKLDHFRITTMQRGTDKNFEIDKVVHEKFGDKPTQIPVVLLYDDIDLNLQTRYSCYAGKTLWCTGNGEKARRITHHAVAAEKGKEPQPAQYAEVDCTCYRQDPTYTGKDKCKINGNLSVMIMGVDVVGGVWKFRTTSYNTVVGLMSALALIQRITGGPLAGVPLMLTVTPKSVTDPVAGGQQTIYVVGLEYRGSIESLQDRGYTELLTRQKHGMRIEHIEQQALERLAADPRTFAAPDDVDEEIAEFYPEQLEDGTSTADRTPPPPPPAGKTTTATATPSPAKDVPASLSALNAAAQTREKPAGDGGAAAAQAAALAAAEAGGDDGSAKEGDLLPAEESAGAPPPPAAAKRRARGAAAARTEPAVDATPETPPAPPPPPAGGKVSLF